MKTHVATPEDIQSTHKFLLIDAEGLVLGRLASVIAKILSGKHKAVYTPFLDTGDHVIVVNAEKICLTGKKMDDKFMIHHSMYPGGMKKKAYKEVLDVHPERAIMNAVSGMLPKNSLGRKMLTKLRVYKGGAHPHASCKPVPFEVK